jgi:hypothetical protein
VQGYDNTSGMSTKDKVMSAIPGKYIFLHRFPVKEPWNLPITCCIAASVFARILARSAA